MIQIEDLSFGFKDQTVLTDINLALEPKKIYGVIGPSGVGKSVLLKILGRIYSPLHGQVRYSDMLEDEIGLMFQGGALFDSVNTFDNVAFPLVNGRVPTSLLSDEELSKVEPKVRTILSQVGLSRAILKDSAQLSGGMRRRVALARALVSQPKLALLDDPTAGLDPVASSVIMALIVQLHKAYQPTTLIVSHDLRRLLPVVDCIIALWDGKVVFNGELKELQGYPHEGLARFIRCRYDFKDGLCH